jgi:hypothetical protein
MSDTCGNPACSVPRHPDNGKLFCAEIEISSEAALRQRTIAYIWLCDYCARQMKPESEVAGEVIRVLLSPDSAASAPVSGAVH